MADETVAGAGAAASVVATQAGEAEDLEASAEATLVAAARAVTGSGSISGKEPG